MIRVTGILLEKIKTSCCKIHEDFVQKGSE